MAEAGSGNTNFTPSSLKGLGVLDSVLSFAVLRQEGTAQVHRGAPL